MFAITGHGKLVNLAQCISIELSGYNIEVYVPSDVDDRYPERLANFLSPVEAGYAFYDLFRSLNAGKTTMGSPAPSNPYPPCGMK